MKLNYCIRRINCLKFKTKDHVYSSVALSAKDLAKGEAPSIYSISTDGFLYKLNHDGELIWSFDIGDVSRSSPVVGLSKDGDDIIYFGAGDGKIYAVNGDGSFRWSYNTTQEKPGLEERNDLNASPALGRKGVFIGGEHGQLWFIPYDYPLYNENDPRVSVDRESLEDGISVRYLSSGAQIMDQNSHPTLDIASPISLRILDVKNGKRQETAFYTWFGRTKISIEPQAEFTWEPSPNGDTILIRPQNFWEEQTNYTIKIDGYTMKEGWKIGNFEVGATEFEPFTEVLTFSTVSYS